MIPNEQKQHPHSVIQSRENNKPWKNEAVFSHNIQNWQSHVLCKFIALCNEQPELEHRIVWRRKM